MPEGFAGAPLRVKRFKKLVPLQVDECCLTRSGRASRQRLAISYPLQKIPIALPFRVPGVKPARLARPATGFLGIAAPHEGLAIL